MADNITILQGSLYLDPFKKDASGNYMIGTYTGEFEVGECSDISISVSSETKTFFGNRRRIKQKIAAANTQFDAKLSFQTENFNDDNLARAFFGSVDSVTNTATAVAGENIGTVLQGARYQLGRTTANPNGTVKLNTSVAPVVKTVTPAATLVAGTDYTVDYETGGITIISSSPSGKVVIVDYTPTAQTRQRIMSTNTPFKGGARFLSDNAEGANRDIYIPYLVLTPKGDVGLITQDWANLQFDAELLLATGYTSPVYAAGRPVT